MKLKSILLPILLMFYGTSQVSAGNPDEGKAVITFDETSHDFGVIREKDGSVTHTFEFTNTGDAPLLVLSASASCGCTRPEYPQKPIKPGKKDKITVTYNPKGRPGEFSKNVTIRTNAKGKKKVTLKIKGNVVPEE